jgi:uncharacterized iron-regulated membrane protein
MKVFFRRIHLYLSFAAGLVILIACLTGAILVFEKDLQMGLNKSRYYVKNAGEKQSLTQLVSHVRDSFPGYRINAIRVYKDAERSAEILVSAPVKKESKAPESPGAKPAPPPRQPGFTIFTDPYSGQILQKYSYQETFFYQVFALHRWLLGGQNGIGKLIVGIATFLFLFILLTGLILWWPKTKKIMMQRLKIKTSASWKRLNHDLHIVLGFYSAIFLFIFAFTGLAWSFEWFNKGIYTVTNSPMQAAPPPKSVYVANAQKINPDQAFAAAKAVYPEAESFNISFPKDSTEAINVTMLNPGAAHESATDAVYIDQYSGKVLGQLPFSQRSLGARVRSSFKPIHTGSIWGMPSKIIAFIVCLLGVTFPVTGTILWWNRTRKKKNGKAATTSLVEVDA